MKTSDISKFKQNYTEFQSESNINFNGFIVEVKFPTIITVMTKEGIVTSVLQNIHTSISLTTENSFDAFSDFSRIIGGALPGKTCCSIFGSRNEICDEKDVPLNKLPKECTNYFYEGFLIDSEADEISNSLANVDTTAVLKRLLKDTDKPFYVCLGHLGYLDWNGITDKECKGASKDVQIVQKFLAGFDNRIIGIVFDKFEPITERPEADFAEKLGLYIETFKKNFPKLQFGLKLPSSSLLQFSKPSMINFNCLSNSVDFFVIDLTGLNDCSKDTIGGTAPVKGQGKVKGLDQLEKEVLPNVSTDKSKIYFSIDLTAQVPESGEHKFCVSSYDEICNKPDDTKSWCADSSCSYRDKGKFAAQYGGFIARGVDLDDSKGDCDCGQPFPAFHFLVDGSSGGGKSEPCKKFDRT